MNDWELILQYLRSMAHTDVIVEYSGKRWFYTQPEGIQRGIFMLPGRAPNGTPIIDGAVLLSGAIERAA